MGWPTLQAKALPNSGMLETTPLIRYSSGEWGLVMALARLLCATKTYQGSSARLIRSKACAYSIFGIDGNMGFEFCCKIIFRVLTTHRTKHP